MPDGAEHERPQAWAARRQNSCTGQTHGSTHVVPFPLQHHLGLAEEFIDVDVIGKQREQLCATLRLLIS